MKKKIVLILCALIVLAAPMLVLAETAAVCAPSGKLHLRAAASADSESLGLFFSGTQVVVTGDIRGNFIPVRAGALEGYMHADYLALGDAAGSVTPAQPIGVATPKVGARLRSGPSTEHETLLVMDQGETFTVLGETKNHWYYADYCGQRGYVSAEVASIVGQTDMVPEAFRAILMGAEPFERRGGRTMIGELGECFGAEAELLTTGFVPINLDEDALKEVVVRVTSGGYDFGFLVLDVQTEVVYGYTFYLRSMLDIKQDGTFAFSSGAMDSGVGRLSFRGPVADVIPVEIAEQAQDAKPGVDWHPFIREEIERLYSP